MPTGRYAKALGLDSDHQVRTDLSPSGALMWAVSKAPAMAGGLWADWVYKWAIEKWPTYKRGPEFVGGVCVLLGGYAMQVLVTRMSPDQGHIVDKVTDGMVGRYSPVVWGLIKGILPEARTTGEKYLKAITGTAEANLDGDRQSISEVAGLLRDSPETTKLMADNLVAAMRRDGHNVDDAAHLAVVQSFRDVIAETAAGRF